MRAKLTLLQVFVVGLLNVYECLPEAMVEGVAGRVVQHQFHHLLELFCVLGQNQDLPELQFLEEVGRDSVGEFVCHYKQWDKIRGLVKWGLLQCSECLWPLSVKWPHK